MARWSLARGPSGFGSPNTDAMALVIGRILLSLIFILSGVHKLFDFGQVSAGAAAEGLVAANFFVVLALIVEIVCGLGLLFGFFARASAIILAIYLIPVTLVFHAFWNASGGEATAQFFNFWKNVAIAGGLLLVAFGPRAESVGERPQGPAEIPAEPE
ncbi:MAG TPA: DoxX family protein [Kofleriaceae bacterium]|nr:DoxX family protein [Kofleriaceae bacterium]